MQTENECMKQNVYAVGILVGIIAFLYQAIPIIASLNSWGEWDQPAIASKFLWAFLWALVSFAFAIGIDVRKFIGNFIPSFNQSVSQAKINEINKNDGMGV